MTVPFEEQSRHRRHAAAAAPLWKRIGEKVMASPRGLREYVRALPAGLRTESVHGVFVHIVGEPHGIAYAEQATTVTGWAATQGVDLRETFDEIAGSATAPGVSSAWPAGFQQRPVSATRPAAAEPEPDAFSGHIAVLQQTIQQQNEIIARQDATLQNYQRIINDQALVIDRQAEQLKRNEELILRMDQRLSAQDDLLARAVGLKNPEKTAPRPTSRVGRHARPDADVEEELPNLPLSEEESQRTAAVNARAQRTLAAVRARKFGAPLQRNGSDAQRRVVARHPVQRSF
ncbi:hypothetical protein [Fodinicola acaciae]|uniref:hypothetical protein n=1 Tax=Fodinicola acaciae TaxID=2681555 RepID=UPI0013D7A4D6|nr:hypothetical protein [Fodinicola acaciae]